MSVFAQGWLQGRTKRQDISFEERKAAYIGLLEAYHKAAIEPCVVNSKNFAYWQMRCELVAPLQVRKAIEGIISTNENFDNRIVAHEELKQALRNDLDVASK